MISIDARVYALADSGKKEDLKAALQYAVELEHATMPPYLYALYSLGRSNRTIQKVLREIVMDEMVHMLLAGNILKAIGGSPNIDRALFVPNYPTHLPGSVADDFRVHLRRFSKEQAKNVFMRIEQPEHILDFQKKKAALVAAAGRPVHTIGEFYKRIRKTFEDRGDELIVDKTGATQPTTDRLGITVDEQKITSAQRAIDAINLIVEQGEGTTKDPHIPDGDDLPHNSEFAHYYRFAQLVKGRIEPNPDATSESPPEDQHIYNPKKRVKFEKSKVLAFPDNPKAAHFDEGTDQRKAIDRFNRSYTKMLKLLHEAFNSNPGRLEDAVSEMTEMKEAAQRLAEFELGPTFEFIED